MAAVIVRNFNTQVDSDLVFDYSGPAGVGLTSNGGRWGWNYEETPSSDTGPSEGFNLGYIYTESSSPTDTGDKFTAITKDTFDLSNATMDVEFMYNVNVRNTPIIEVSVWDGYKWNLESTVNIDPNNLKDVWVNHIFNVSTYTNSDCKIKIDITITSTSKVYRNDVGIDAFIVTIKSESDPVIDFFKTYNIKKFKHGGNVFDGAQLLEADLLVIINEFLLNIANFSFANYPDGVLVYTTSNDCYLLSYGVNTYSMVGTDITVINDAASLVGWTGTQVAIDRNISKSKSTSLSFSTNNDVVQYTLTTPVDVTNQTLRMWLLPTMFLYLKSKFIKVDISDGTTTATYNVNITSYVGGWLDLIIDFNILPITGSTDLTLVNSITIYLDYNTSLPMVTNTWIDFIRLGNTITLTGESTNLNTIIKTTANESIGFGMVDTYHSNHYINSNVTIGGTNNTTYNEYESVVVFNNLTPVVMKYIGDVNYTNIFNVKETLIKTTNNSIYDLDMSDINITNILFILNIVMGASSVSFPNKPLSTLIKDNKFIDVGSLYINGATFKNNFIIDSGKGKLGSVIVKTDTDLDNSANITFLNNTNYCIYVEAGVTVVNLDNFYFDNVGSNNILPYIYWAGTTGTLTVNAINYTNVTPTSVLSAGGTINIIKTNPIDIETLNLLLETVASDVRAIKVAQGANLQETSTLINIANGVKLVL